jgi:hypothetical protein
MLSLAPLMTLIDNLDAPVDPALGT